MKAAAHQHFFYPRLYIPFPRSGIKDIKFKLIKSTKKTQETLNAKREIIVKSKIKNNIF